MRAAQSLCADLGKADVLDLSRPAVRNASVTQPWPKTKCHPSVLYLIGHGLHGKLNWHRNVGPDRVLSAAAKRVRNTTHLWRYHKSI